jgi:uncharacterized membrane protein YeaQ/YmgE (transglycosylase-associated protein family)
LPGLARRLFQPAERLGDLLAVLVPGDSEKSQKRNHGRHSAAHFTLLDCKLRTLELASSQRALSPIFPGCILRRADRPSSNPSKERAMGIIWTIIIGFIAGVIAKFIMPGSTNEPSGFILTAILGIVGAIVASYLGQALGWYAPGEGAGLIGAVVGAIIVLFVWGLIARRKA